MAGILKHRYSNPHADVAGSTKTQASHWNDFLMATGGAHGDTLTRDTSDSTYGMKWTSGGVSGIWQTHPFTAADFTALAPMTFTVTAAPSINRYTRIGQTLLWALTIGANATLGGSASSQVRVRLPGGFTPSVYMAANYARCLSGGSDLAIEIGRVSGTEVAFVVRPSANFVLGAFTVSLVMLIEVD
jgi:hypothetical protein